MDWITGLQKAIDYIEDNLTETIDYEAVAAHYFSSNHHFQRIFGIQKIPGNLCREFL